MHNKLIALLTIFSLNSISVQSQVCDCDIFPVKKECKVDCGIKILQSGTNEQIVQKLKVKKETAQRIVNVQTRRNYKEVTDFKDDLPLKYYQDLEQRFNLYLSNNLFQNNFQINSIKYLI